MSGRARVLERPSCRAVLVLAHRPWVTRPWRALADVFRVDVARADDLDSAAAHQGAEVIGAKPLPCVQGNLVGSERFVVHFSTHAGFDEGRTGSEAYLCLAL